MKAASLSLPPRVARVSRRWRARASSSTRFEENLTPDCRLADHQVGSDLAVDAFPVRVAELALDELAVGLAGEGVDVVDRAGQLELAHAGAGPLDDLGAELVGALEALVELDDGLDLLAPVRVRDAEHGDVLDGR